MQVDTAQIGNRHSVNGLNSAYQNLQKKASEIASTDALSNKESSIQALVELKESEINISSIAKVVETEKDLLGVILDIKA